MGPERKHGLSTKQFPVSAYVGSSKNLKDLKDVLDPLATEGVYGRRVGLATAWAPGGQTGGAFWYRGTSLIRNTHPPSISIGP